MTSLTEIDPSDIENRSFSIIESEFFERTSINKQSIDPDTFTIIRRVIHATGDFSFAKSIVFQENAVQRGIESILMGKNIFIDVTMGASGISRSILHSFGGEVVCHINDPDIAEMALKEGRTRTETSLRSITNENIGILAVGNAPTALIGAMEMIEKKEIKPDLVIGVPVGFVNAEESKELLMERTYPFISSKGRKGGSSIAVAIINALLRLAQTEGNK